MHAIRESELADKSFNLPKIPKKQEVKPVQISMAEILDEEGTSTIAEQIAKIEGIGEESTRTDTNDIPELNAANIQHALLAFAANQKTSVSSLIKQLIPESDGKSIRLRMNSQQEGMMSEVRIEWQAFLKKYFRDPEISLAFIIDNEVQYKVQAYTPAEQFEEMLNENEMFRKMVNIFKLKLKN